MDTSAPIDDSRFTVDCGGDVCRGDTILIVEEVINRRHKQRLGVRRIVAEVADDSICYGERTPRNCSFRLLLATVEGCGSRKLRGAKFTSRSGSQLDQLSRRTVRRIAWTDETERQRAIAERQVRWEADRQAMLACERDDDDEFWDDDEFRDDGEFRDEDGGDW